VKEELQQLHQDRDRVRLRLGQLPPSTSSPHQTDAAIAAADELRAGLQQASGTLSKELEACAAQQEALQARLEAQQQAVAESAMHKVANVLMGVSEGVDGLLAALSSSLVPDEGPVTRSKAAAAGKRGAAAISSSLAAATQEHLAVACCLSHGCSGPADLRGVHQALKLLQVSLFQGGLLLHL
jgi:regulator of protease activity HflC (stomatin/prohibitin superfamily)